MVLEKKPREKLRGEDLREIKLRAIGAIRIVLISTVQRDVNEDEIGSLVDFALSRKSTPSISRHWLR
jgi:uncharacterized radical SAM superfamily Fe-S cluster-containing enzyme